MSGSFNPNAFGGSTAKPKPPKKFLPRAGVGTAGKLKISLISVSVGPALAGQEDRLLFRFAIKNTDPKKEVSIGALNPLALDDNAKNYNASDVRPPRSVEAASEVNLLVAANLPAKNAKSIRLVLADGIGWELKRADWEMK